MTGSKLKHWLRETDPKRLSTLWQQADAIRRDCVGYAVHLRGLIEVSNFCTRQCTYCGLRASHRALDRYRMSADEVLACARQATASGFGTVVLQSGEDPQLDSDWVTDVVKRIKSTHDLAVTLSLGEREPDELRRWRDAGADRYLLRFETSDPALYSRIHPPRPGASHTRLELLRLAREMGYEIGSGVMIGIPGQTYESLEHDLDLFRQVDLDMIGVGPYVPHPATPLGEALEAAGPTTDQVPNDATTTYIVMALTRLVCPLANIPSTTALATLQGPEGQMLGLQRGANVIMPNLTPTCYRERYDIYPDKACNYDDAPENLYTLHKRIRGIGRKVGTGRGDAPNKRRRTRDRSISSARP